MNTGVSKPSEFQVIDKFCRCCCGGGHGWLHVMDGSHMSEAPTGTAIDLGKFVFVVRRLSMN